MAVEEIREEIRRLERIIARTPDAHLISVARADLKPLRKKLKVAQFLEALEALQREHGYALSANNSQLEVFSLSFLGDTKSVRDMTDPE